MVNLPLFILQFLFDLHSDKNKGKLSFHIMKKNILFLFFISMAILISCKSGKLKVDAIYTNGIVYTVDSSFHVEQAFAIQQGKFLEVGKNETILSKYESDSVIDLKGKFVYPGFIDAHCHFYGYGAGLQTVNLLNCKSAEEMLQRVIDFYKKNKGEWIIGRGWDQNLFLDKKFPQRDMFDKAFPETPVFLQRVDGHAALVNGEALKRAGINSSLKISGGVIENINGKLSGILIDNAVALMEKSLPKPRREQIEDALLKAQENCLRVGLTTVDDAGLDRNIIEIIDSLQKTGKLKIRIYAMISATKENRDYYLKKGIYKTDLLNVRSFKVYADGALGSRGACLLKPYTDKTTQSGFLLNSILFFDSLAKECNQYGFQMNTHCIGDSANRLLLNIYSKALATKNDKRWRIEHAQVVSMEDIEKFGKYNVIPSVQPTHATSDMYWAKDRLGSERVKTAYAYQSLLKQNTTIALGSDFPVEDINPLYGFYAAVARQDKDQFPAGAFQSENALTPEQALRGMTIWAAFANFEEKEKGSIEKGKFADFVILDHDLMNSPIRTCRDLKVLRTVINGR